MGGESESTERVVDGRAPLEVADMKIAPDGSCEVATSSEPQPGNWLLHT